MIKVLYLGIPEFSFWNDRKFCRSDWGVMRDGSSLYLSLRQPFALGEVSYDYLAPNFQKKTWLWVKNRYPKWNPGKRNQGLKPVPWWLNFDPYPHVPQQSGLDADAAMRAKRRSIAKRV